MSTTLPVPERMLPIRSLLAPVEVVRGPQLRLVGEGDSAKPKVSDDFPGRQAYSMTVEVVAGFRTKTLPGREPFSAADLRKYSVTVWAESQPACMPGDYVRLEGLCAGSFDRGFYLWASGAERVEVETTGKEG